MESEIRFRSSIAVECVANEAAVTRPRGFEWQPKLGWLGHASSGPAGLFGSVCDSHTGYRGHRSAVGEADHAR